MGTKRIYSLDFVKLVAIYLVLWGHCIQSLIPEVGSGEGKPVLYIFFSHESIYDYFWIFCCKYRRRDFKKTHSQ